jgi:hypothetical protein
MIHPGDAAVAVIASLSCRWRRSNHYRIADLLRDWVDASPFLGSGASPMGLLALETFSMSGACSG